MADKGCGCGKMEKKPIAPAVAPKKEEVKKPVVPEKKK